jgi:dihydrofolate reductase
MKISIVVAMAENRAIGKNGDLLWHLPRDMKRFKEITMGHSVVMGRKTYESIPEKFRPLPGRTNIVISSSAKAFNGCLMAKSLNEAIETARLKGEQELMIIGGGSIYEQALPLADKLYLTIVHENFDADTFFPELSVQDWIEVSKESIPTDEKNQYAMTFTDWERKI